jgi:hypothetical protein
MVLGAPRQRARVFASALATILMLNVGEAAQAACYSAGQQLPAQVVSRFTNDPGRLLTQFPDGGPQMISLIRDLVASDPGTLLLITGLNAEANTDQAEAIGTGLGQAALVCARTAQAFADEIQRVTIAANNKPMTQAFGAVMGDQFLGLAAPAVGGGGAGATGQTASTAGAAASGASLNLTTSVSNTTTASSGFTPSAAVGGVSGSSGSSASTSLGGTASVGNSGSTASLGNPAGTASVENPGGTIFLGSSGGPIFGGNPNGTAFAGSPNSSVAPKLLGSVNTPSFTKNINSPVSPTQ